MRSHDLGSSPFSVDFLDDWVGTEQNDILNFVPIDWKIGADLDSYEIYFFTNRYNWIDEGKDSLEDCENLDQCCICILSSSVASSSSCLLW